VTNATASRIYGTVSAERQKEMSGLEFVQGLATGTLPLNMIAKTLGYDVIEAEKGRVVVAVEPSEGHLNPYGRVHGGLTATLLDSCMGLAVQSTLEKGFGQTTVEFKISLSPDARCNRFMHPLREPSSELLRQFTHVDYTNHVALVAQTFVDNRENVIGEARYVRVAEPSSAEISMSVADPWQRNGLAAPGSRAIFTYVREDFIEGRDLAGQVRLYDHYVRGGGALGLRRTASALGYRRMAGGWSRTSATKSSLRELCRATARRLAAMTVERLAQAEKQ
jgi:uncharacterized protein (TIGR00369 family)